MNEIEKFVMICSDNILVFSKTPQEDFGHLQKVSGR